jgi:hypothetical protein
MYEITKYTNEMNQKPKEFMERAQDIKYEDKVN